MKKKRPKVVILGGQASGKGTQAHILSTWSGSPKVSVGDILRELQNEDSERGRTIKEYLSKGALVPDELSLAVVKEWIDQHRDGWIVDGFPRTRVQVEYSASWFDPDAVVFLDLPDDDSKRRVSYRRVCAKCKTNYNVITQPPKNTEGLCDVDGGELVIRPDDTPEIINERLRIYHQKTEPIKDWFRPSGKLIEIDAKPGIIDVAHDIQQQLTNLTGKKKRSGKKLKWILIITGLALLLFAALVAIGSLQG